MKILFVTNNINIPGNGICTSVNTTVQHLRERGIDARFLSGISKDTGVPQPDFPLDRLHFPIFQPIIDANGFCYAKRDRRVIRKAVEWADIIHITEPLFLQKDAIRMAENMGKPIVGTFHLYTQNILNELPLASWKLSNDLLMRNWINAFFNRCSFVQCPTQAVRQLLEKHNCKSNLEVISNGTTIPAEPIKARMPSTKPYLILTTGRLCEVKKQMTLVDAMRYSRHSGEIQLFFAGNGVNRDKIMKAGSKLVSEGVLRYPPVIKFLTTTELAELNRKAYLYVHCSKMEVEGLGCLEAIKEGTVPIISQSELVGTTDFALDGRSLFPACDAKALADRIDWWIEHPREREIMGQEYADFSRKFDIGNSITSLIEMYQKALTR